MIMTHQLLIIKGSYRPKPSVKKWIHWLETLWTTWIWAQAEALLHSLCNSQLQINLNRSSLSHKFNSLLKRIALAEVICWRLLLRDPNKMETVNQIGTMNKYLFKLTTINKTTKMIGNRPQMPLNIRKITCKVSRGNSFRKFHGTKTNPRPKKTTLASLKLQTITLITTILTWIRNRIIINPYLMFIRMEQSPVRLKYKT